MVVLWVGLGALRVLVECGRRAVAKLVAPRRLYEVQELPGVGRCLVAAVDLPPGAEVIRETPLLRIPLAEEARGWAESAPAAFLAFLRLPSEGREAVLNLQPHPDTDP
eukprot:Hpha_TRINITY_DN26445_c0_g1::TRINITY_DN26445_c0_g1_i1::g.33925::m.33925